MKNKYLNYVVRTMVGFVGCLLVMALCAFLKTSDFVGGGFTMIGYYAFVQTYDWLRMNEERDEILNGYSWIKVKRYVDSSSDSAEEKLKKLESHHAEETTFLINKIREIVKNQ